MDIFVLDLAIILDMMLLDFVKMDKGEFRLFGRGLDELDIYVVTLYFSLEAHTYELKRYSISLANI